MISSRYDKKIKTGKTHRGGFVLLVLVMLMGLIGTVMVCLTSNANMLRIDSNNLYLKAGVRNLEASGQAWALLHVQEAGKEPLEKTLDVESLTVPGGSLKVFMSQIDETKQRVVLETTYQRGQKLISDENSYVIRGE